MDPSRDLIWFKLGDYLPLIGTQSRPIRRRSRNGWIPRSRPIRRRSISRRPPVNDKDPNAAKNLAAYYNNLADASTKLTRWMSGQNLRAGRAGRSQRTPAQSYFNIGAVLTNAGKVDDAIVAFDKVIAADPTRADAYYWKGVNLIGKATMQGQQNDCASGHCGSLPEVSGTAAHPVSLPRVPKRCWPALARRLRPPSARRRRRLRNRSSSNISITGAVQGPPFLLV